MVFGRVLGCFMVIVGASRTSKCILYHVVVPDTSEYLPAYHTKSRSQVPKMLDFVILKKMLILPPETRDQGRVGGGSAEPLHVEGLDVPNIRI